MHRYTGPHKKVHITFKINSKRKIGYKKEEYNPDDLVETTMITIVDELKKACTTPEIKDNIMTVPVYHSKKREFIAKMCRTLEKYLNKELKKENVSVEYLDYKEEPSLKEIKKLVKVKGYKVDETNYEQDDCGDDCIVVVLRKKDLEA